MTNLDPDDPDPKENMTNLDPVDPDPKDTNIIVLQLVKKCTTFIPNGLSEIGKKMQDMTLLYYTWSADTDEDYSADVYAAVVEMFAANAFRPLPPSAYAADDEEDAATALSSSSAAAAAMAAAIAPPPLPPAADGWSRTDAGQGPAGAEALAAAEVEARAVGAQTTAAHTTFQVFVDRARFDAAAAAAWLDRRFAGRLAHRLNSADDQERLLACDTMGRLWRACPPARGRLLDAAVAEMAELAYGYAPRHNGVADLLGFFADAVADKCVAVGPADLEKLFKVFIQLLKHQSLFIFKYRLVECVRAFNYSHPDLVFRILESIVKFWSCHNRNTINLLRIMVELYEWCVRDKWVTLQLRVVGRLSKLFYDHDFQLAEEAMNFWNRILNDNITFWRRQESDIATVVNALKKVKRTHWNSDCVKMATCMLNIMESTNLIKACNEEVLDKVMCQDKDTNALSYYTYNHILQVQLNNYLIDKPAETLSTVEPYP